MSDTNKCNKNTDGCTGDPHSCELDPTECHAAMSGKSSISDSARENVEDCLGRSLETLSNAFTASAKRWETIVYPSLFAFILLAGYGFYLIYNLTRDVSTVAQHMELIAKDMHKVSANMVLMTQTVDSQSAAMHEMTTHMRHMSISMNQMRYDLAVMNNSVSRPMSFMNSFMPW